MNLIEQNEDRGILIVDDDERTVELYKNILERSGYRNVYSAYNGTEALSLLSEYGEKIYLVLLDLVMPDMDGLEVVKHLSNIHNYPVGIIIVTGYPTILSAKEFFTIESKNVLAVDFITKPFEMEKILNDVRKTLDLIHRKRQGNISISTETLYKRLDNIEKKISLIEMLPEIKREIENISRRQYNFLAQLGLDVIRIILIAIAILGLLYLDVDNFLHAIISKIR